jgi:hypothetical protein
MTPEQKFRTSPAYLRALADGRRALNDAVYAAYVANLQEMHDARQTHDIDLSPAEYQRLNFGKLD